MKTHASFCDKHLLGAWDTKAGETTWSTVSRELRICWEVKLHGQWGVLNAIVEDNLRPCGRHSDLGMREVIPEESEGDLKPKRVEGKGFLNLCCPTW